MLQFSARFTRLGSSVAYLIAPVQLRIGPFGAKNSVSLLKPELSLFQPEEVSMSDF